MYTQVRGLVIVKLSQSRIHITAFITRHRFSSLLHRRLLLILHYRIITHKSTLYFTLEWQGKVKVTCLLVYLKRKAVH